MIFYDTLIISYVRYLYQSTFPVFMITNKQSQSVISAEIALALCLIKISISV